jgi:aspartate/tyrosine/aromatic aminotransferase
MSTFSNVPLIGPDPVFHMLARYKTDTAPDKVNLTVGAYATAEGKEYVLDEVRLTEQEIVADPNLTHSYLKITGDPEFTNLSVQLVLGTGNAAQANNAVAAVQTLSGTGALRLLSVFLATHFPGITMLKSNPTWSNHKTIFRESGLAQIDYRYWDAAGRKLDIDGMLEDLTNAPNKSAVLLHCCAHNPTGVDPTKEQWVQIMDVMKTKGHIALFDSAYQGYATGDLEEDAYAVRLFLSNNVPLAVAQSYSKNLGLYGERIGCASIVCATADEAQACQSQLAALIRPMYSNPPRFGAAIVKRILGNPEKRARWEIELKGMADRIADMRLQFRALLEEYHTPGDWSHVTSQIGMFCYTGVSVEQAEHLIDHHHVYLLKSGRISVAGLNPSNIEKVAKAFDDAIRTKASL